MKDRVMTENEAIEELKYDCNEIGKAIPCDTSWGESFENAYAMAINALEEIEQYRTIGTVEECRVAVEKQKAKKIEIFNGQASCPNCKCLFGGMDVIKSLIAWHMPHCRECGQHIDWSEEE